MQPHRLLFITTGLNTGGAEKMLYKLLSRLDRLRFDPVVVSLADKGTVGSEIETLGVPVHAIGMQFGTPPLKGLLKLRQLVRQLRPDLIQGWMYHGNLAALAASPLSGPSIPKIWNVRGTNIDLDKESLVSGLVFRLCGWLSNIPNKTINNSRFSAQAHSEKLGYPQDKWVFIPNGFDTEKFAPSEEDRRLVRQQLGFSNDVVLIGMVARYHPMKDHLTFLNAVARLLSRYPDTRFVLVGGGVSPANPELTAWVSKLGIGYAIHLLGERSDIPELLTAFDIQTSSSAWGENFPNVLGEAMACGVPCVTTDVGDSAWIVGNTGRVVPPRDPDRIAEAWAELIALGADGRQRLGAAARLRVLEHFSLDAVVRQYEALFEEELAACAG